MSARPFALFIITHAIGVLHPFQNRVPAIKRGLERRRRHLAHAAAHPRNRLVAHNDQPLFVTRFGADITQPLVKRKFTAGRDQARILPGLRDCRMGHREVVEIQDDPLRTILQLHDLAAGARVDKRPIEEKEGQAPDQTSAP